MYHCLVQHLSKTSNHGIITPFIPVFPPKQPGQRGFRIWNSQLLGFAAWRRDDGSIIGDPANLMMTSICEGYGWRAVERGPFCILPLLLEAPGYPPQLFELPEHVHHVVELTHSDYPALARLKLRWYGIPALAALCFDLGGVHYSCAPFNGWYMGTEIMRDLLDTQRYNLITQIQRALELPTETHALHRDHVQLIVNQAILQSFDSAGIMIQDHHSASDGFMRFYEDEQRVRGYCPSDWVWLVPPAAGSTTKVFHQEMINFVCKPCYRAQTSAWLGAPRQLPEASQRARMWWKRLRLVVSGRHGERLAGKLGRMEAPIFVVYGSEMGQTASLARRLHCRLNLSAGATLVSMDDFKPEKLYAQDGSILVIMTSTYGYGLPPRNAHGFLKKMRAHAKQLRDSRSHFIVLGVGSSKYGETFCLFAREVDCMLGEELGMQRLTELTKADVADSGVFEQTVSDWIDTVGFLMSSTSTSRRGQDWMAVANPPSGTLSAQELSPLVLEQRVMVDDTLMLLSFRCPGVVHDVGDHIVIMPENDTEDVVRAATIVRLGQEDDTAAENAVPPLSQLVVVSGLGCIGLIPAGDPLPTGIPEHGKGTFGLPMTLEMLLRKYAGEVRRWEWSTPRALGDVLHTMPLTTGRMYTVASHRKDGFDLLVTRHVDGWCSQWLASLKLGTSIFGSVHRVTDYADRGGPVVVLGAGSGAALALGFLAAWKQGKRQSAVVRAYLGFRGKKSESLEAVLAEAAGSLASVRLAYSQHPTQPKQYVQDLLAADADWLRAQLAQPNACMYLCGSPTLASAVHDILDSICMDGLSAMQNEGRYVAEVY